MSIINNIFVWCWWSTTFLFSFSFLLLHFSYLSLCAVDNQLRMELLCQTVRNHLVNKRTLTQRIVINFSCAPTERWHWKHARMACCSTEKVPCIITATTIGPLIVDHGNMIVRKFTIFMTFWNDIWFDLFEFQQRQFRHLAVNTRSESIRTVQSVRRVIWNVLTVFRRSINVTPDWPTMNAFTAAIGRINYFTFAIQKVSLTIRHFIYIFVINFCVCFCSCCRFHMPDKSRWTSRTVLAIPTFCNSRRQTSSHHMRRRPSTFDFMRRRINFQRTLAHLWRTLKFNNRKHFAKTQNIRSFCIESYLFCYFFSVYFIRPVTLTCCQISISKFYFHRFQNKKFIVEKWEKNFWFYFVWSAYKWVKNTFEKFENDIFVTNEEYFFCIWWKRRNSFRARSDEMSKNILFVQCLANKKHLPKFKCHRLFWNWIFRKTILWKRMCHHHFDVKCINETTLYNFCHLAQQHSEITIHWKREAFCENARHAIRLLSTLIVSSYRFLRWKENEEIHYLPFRFNRRIW